MSAKDNKIMNSFRKLEKIADLKALLEEQKQDQINKKDMNLNFKVKKKEVSFKFSLEYFFLTVFSILTCAHVQLMIGLK
jgi:hypothetical protein